MFYGRKGNNVTEAIQNILGTYGMIHLNERNVEDLKRLEKVSSD